MPGSAGKRWPACWGSTWRGETTSEGRWPEEREEDDMTMLFGGLTGLGGQEIVFLGGILLPILTTAVVLYLALGRDKEDRGD
jgi:hypothetical protein